MIYNRVHFRVVHRIGQVSHQYDVLAGLCHVPKPEGPAKHAHVRVYTHEDNVFDAVLFQKVPDFNAGIADGIVVAYFNRIYLTFPRPRGTLFATRLIIAAAVGLIDWIVLFFFFIDPVAPFFNTVRQVICFRRILRPLASGMVGIGLNSAARGMDYQNAFIPSLRNHIVHIRCKLSDAVGSSVAPVLVPHITYYDRSLFGIPFDFLLYDPESARIIG
jgi:hypothetical protein